MRIANSRDAEMIALYRAGKTLQEIGTVYGISRERVRQIISADGVKASDGGAAKKANERRSTRLSEINQRSLAKWGCTREQYTNLLSIGLNDRPCKRPTFAYSSQRAAAARRGIEWNLSLWQWWSIWEDSGKWSERGRGDGYVMCRKGDAGPYAPGNVFIATARQNASEGPHKKSDLPMGVVKNERYKSRPYFAVAHINGVKKRLGHYATPERAGAAYLRAISASSPQASEAAP
jgi:hypothetical protein